MDKPDLEKLKGELSRIQIEPVQLGSFPVPPDDPRLALGLQVGGGFVGLVGLWLVWLGLCSLMGVFLAAGLGILAYGALLVLYGRFHGPWASQPMPAHPASTAGEQRSVWETAATVALVMGVLNLPLLCVVAGIAGMLTHWSVSLLVALGANVAAFPLAWRGDGTNRRPIRPVRQLAP